MEYRLGKSKRILEAGQTVKLECPNCKRKVNFSVFSNMNTSLIPSLPLVKLENVYFLVCPECAAVYGVDSSKGKALKNGEQLAIGNYDLKELKAFEI